MKTFLKHVFFQKHWANAALAIELTTLGAVIVFMIATTAVLPVADII
jgi:hypothetical protein